MWRRKKHRVPLTVPETLSEALWRRLGPWGILLRVLWGTARSLLYGYSLLLSTFIGRIVAVFVAGAALLDAGFGADMVGLPVFDWRAVLAALVAGFFGWRRRMRYEEHVAAVVRDVVPGHSTAQPAIVWFLPRPTPSLELGRWLGTWRFGFRIPAGMKPSKEAEVSEHLRNRLPLAEGTSLAIDWDWSRGTASVRLVEDLPDVVSRAPGEVSPDPEKVPLGVGLSGVVYWVLDNNFGNVFVTGGPGGGKSVIVNTIFRHLLEHIGAFVVYGIDLKGGVELSHLVKYRNVRTVADDLDSSVTLLRRLRAEVDRRQKLLREHGVKKISALNAKLEAAGERPLKRLIVLVDELAELTDIPEQGGDKEQNRARAEAKQLLDSIVRLGRAGGVHLVAALQRPDVRYMTGAMRSNIQCRIVTGRIDRAGCQMVESEIAGELPAIPGRGIFWLGGQEETVQFYLTRDEDLDAVLEKEAAA